MHRHQQWRIIVPFLAPSLLLYFVFVIYPDVQALWVSLHEWSGLSRMVYVGLANFTKLTHDAIFVPALEHNVFFMVVDTICVVFLALVVSVALLSKLPGAGFFRTLYFFPVTISIVAIAAAWKMMYNPIWGPPATLLQILGLVPPMWLGDEHLVLPAIAIVVIWGAMGFHMTLYIAGMQSIPSDYYEAARIDGASAWHQFWHITIPLLWQVLRVSIVFLVIAGMNIFATVQVMMQGDQSGSIPPSAQVLTTYLYQQSFVNAHYGYGAAIGVIVFLLTLIITLIALGFTRQARVEF